ncbi:MAG: glycosyltransferase family 2 protein [Bacteroidales bacterium]|nr:glycosyltransferase family 2 protein [Bacteroidales bacterium]
MNKTADYELTIIVPVFNEEDNLHRLEERLSAFLPGSSRKACVLFVDDGSKDGSLSGIKDICLRHQDFFYISFEKNAGLSAALKAGFDYAESGLVGYIDADLQTEPEDFNLLLQAIDGYSMVIGIRTGRKDSWFKNAQSKIANGFRRMMTHDGAVDTGCPLKVIHTDVAKRIPMFKGMHRFLPALVLLQDEASFKQVPVRHFPRVAGKSKYHLWNRFWGPLADCFTYRWMKRRYLNYKIAESNID